MGAVHQVVIHTVGKVVGGNAVLLQQHNVEHIGRHFNFTANKIANRDFLFHIACRAQAQCPRFAGGKVGFNLLKGQITALCPFAEIAFDGLILLRFTNGADFILRAKTGVRQAFFDQFFCEGSVDFAPFALAVGTVSALIFTLADSAFIRHNAEAGKPVNNAADAAFYFTLFVGIFNS